MGEKTADLYGDDIVRVTEAFPEGDEVVDPLTASVLRFLASGHALSQIEEAYPSLGVEAVQDRLKEALWVLEFEPGPPHHVEESAEAEEEEEEEQGSFGAARETLGFAPVATIARFLEPGWTYQGQPPSVCPLDDGTLHVFRKPYESGGKSYRYWGIVCVEERLVRDLKWFAAEAPEVIKVLRTWSTKQDDSEPESHATLDRIRVTPTSATGQKWWRRRGECVRCGSRTAEPRHTQCEGATTYSIRTGGPGGKPNTHGQKLRDEKQNCDEA